MKIVVNLPEEQVEQLGGVDAAAAALSARLTALPDYKPGDRVLILDAAARAELEQLLSGTSLSTAADLIREVGRLAVFAVGPIVRPLSVSEAARLSVYAASHGISPQVAAEQYLNPILDQFLSEVVG